MVHIHSQEPPNEFYAASAPINLLNRLPDVVEQSIVAADLDGTIIFWNRYGATLYGWQATEIIGRNITELYADTGAPEAWPVRVEQVCNGQPWRGEFLGQHRNGTTFPAYAIDSPLQDERENLTGIIIVSFDLRDKKTAAAERQENLERLRLALNAGNMSIWDWDLLTDEVHLSADGQQLWGLAPAEQYNVNDILKRVHPNDLDNLRQALQAAQAGQANYDYEFRIRHTDGQIRWLVGKGDVIYDQEQQPIRMLGVNFDITTRKTNEQLLQEINETLEKRVAERTAELERSNRELQEFAYVASHDLQEPLRKITAFADRLRSRFGDDLDGTALDYMARMQNAAERMKILINDLLALSRITTRGQPFAQVDLNAVLETVLDDLETTIQAVNGQVTVAALPSIEADPSQIGRLFQNLIGNAVKFHRKEAPPRIEITSQIKEQETDKEAVLQIFVADNGIGFDEKYLDRIFLPFQRLHGRTDYDGSGMGLAICRRIVERHGGTIMATSKPGIGTTFVVSLPFRHVVSASGVHT